mgnify:CR=1 FL=1
MTLNTRSSSFCFRRILKLKFGIYLKLLAASLSVLVCMAASAGPDLGAITAEQALEFVETGIDPVTSAEYGKGEIVIVDVRTPRGYRFQGAAGTGDSFRLNGADKAIVPDLGEAGLTLDGRFVELSRDGKKEMAPMGGGPTGYFAHPGQHPLRLLEQGHHDDGPDPGCICQGHRGTGGPWGASADHRV